MPLLNKDAFTFLYEDVSTQPFETNQPTNKVHIQGLQTDIKNHILQLFEAEC
jgi:hypothetical protein